MSFELDFLLVVGFMHSRKVSLLFERKGVLFNQKLVFAELFLLLIKHWVHSLQILLWINTVIHINLVSSRRNSWRSTLWNFIIRNLILIALIIQIRLWTIWIQYRSSTTCRSLLSIRLKIPIWWLRRLILLQHFRRNQLILLDSWHGFRLS